MLLIHYLSKIIMEVIHMIKNITESYYQIIVNVLMLNMVSGECTQLVGARRY
jgi:hypothetical protein